MGMRLIDNLCRSFSRLWAGKAAVAPRGRRCSCGAVPQSGAEVCREQHHPFLTWAVTVVAVLSGLLPLSPPDSLAAGPRLQIINSAKVLSHQTPVAYTAVTVTEVIRTPSKVEFLQDGTGAPGATPVTVPVTSFSNDGTPSGTFATTGPLTTVTHNTLALPATLPLQPAGAYKGGEPIFVRLSDFDQNLDPLRSETVLLRIASRLTGDTILLRLSETGPDSGVFVGAVQSTSAPVAGNDRQLSVGINDQLLASYTDRVDATDTSQLEIKVDPYGLVFSTSDGAPVSGATVTLWDVTANAPAAVFHDDLSPGYPATVTSGDPAFAFPAGAFRFPFVAPGAYQLKITPPPGYTTPSKVASENIQKLPGNPFALGTGARGETFNIFAGPAVHLDLPVDLQSGSLFISKKAMQEQVAGGEFVQYSLTVGNTSLVGGLREVTIDDRLPVGFRYQKGSVRFDGKVLAEPQVSADGRSLVFALGTLSANTSKELRYVAGVGADAPKGIATNRASATALGNINSNLAQAQVRVVGDLFDSRSLVLGRVMLGNCQPRPPVGSLGLRLTSRVAAGQLEATATITTAKLPATGLTLVVELPEALKYHPGSGRLAEQPLADPEASSNILRFPLGTLPADGQLALRFTGDLATSLLGEYTILAHLEFTDLETATLPGETPLQTPTANNRFQLEAEESGSAPTLLVSKGDSGEKRSLNIAPAPEQGEVEIGLGNPGLDKVRLFMEDGRYVETDPKGLYHFEGLEPGSHVVQVDLDSLPEGMEIFQCEENSRFAGVPHSTFVDLQPGSMWRADFYARSKKPLLGVKNRGGVGLQLTTTHSSDAPELNLKIELSGGRLSMLKRRLYVALPEGLRYLPGSASLDGRPLADPESKPEGLLFALGDRDRKPWQEEVAFRAEILNANDQSSNFTSRAFLRYDKIRAEAEIPTEKPAVDISASAAPTPSTASTPTTPSTEAAAPPQPDGILSVKEGQRLSYRIQAIPVRFDTRLKPELKVDGKLVGEERIGMQFSEKESDRKLVSYIGVDLGEPGPHTLSFRGLDPFGNARFQQVISYLRTSEITTIRLLEAGGNIADGKSPVRVRLELRDQAGELITGESMLTIKDGDLAAPRPAGEELPELREANTLSVDSQGYANFAPVNSSGSHTATLTYGQASAQVRTYVKPQYREWIMVGLAEGSVGYHNLAGNLENLAAAEQEEGYYRDGRLAFYAKGKVKGKYLLTAAYDSARARSNLDNGLFGAIDPNQYYTLYGDKGKGGFDAASHDKLYVKLDGDQFYALYGDFDPGLTVTELSRYSRSLTGFKGEYYGDKVTATGFATESDHAFQKDELPGDGTSGLYHLSHTQIILGSEKITIETRDRFHSEVVLEKKQLARFVDYTFDPQAGTIYFREPIFSRNTEFNPIYIVAEYEMAAGTSHELTGGGRVGYKLDEKGSEAGVSLIHEGTPGARADLQGVDLKYAVNDKTSVKAEAATSSKNVGASAYSGNAFLVEVAHRDSQLESKTYIRQQDGGFGLGQQPGSESGTRKYGSDGRYTLSKQLAVNAEIFRQETTGTKGLQDVADALLTYKLAKFEGSAGLRWARDEDKSGVSRTSTLLTGGLKESFLADRLELYAKGEVATDQAASSDHPNRLILGGEYALTSTTKILAAHEMTWGENQDSQSSRIGFKATPWQETALHSNLEEQSSEAGVRTFASTGLTQGWKLSEALRLDFGLERSQTLRHPGDTPVNVKAPPASGAITDDFTAVSTGATYKEKLWSMTGRAEYRNGEKEDKEDLLWGFYREETPGFGLASLFHYFASDQVSGCRNSKTELEFSAARRPLESPWIVLDKLKFSEQQDVSPTLSSRSRKVVNNLNANYLYDRQNQVSLNHGVKYVIDNFDGAEYAGITQFLAVEYRHDLNKEWDLGVQSAAHLSQVGNNALYSGGVSVGHSLAKNIWLSVGYNASGFRDDDFSGANYTAQGVYLKCRAKFDQNTARQLLAWWEK